MTYYLTRAVLDRRAPEHSIRPLLDPVESNAAFDAHRRLVWTLFPDMNSKRDFLWRLEKNGRFIILSAREPQQSRLFEPLERKQFSPSFSVGDKLIFMLRANATKDRRSRPDERTADGTKRSPKTDRRVDIVMHAMREQEETLDPGKSTSRKSRRMAVAEDASREWLNSQGERRGFKIEKSWVENYRVCKLKRKSGHGISFGILDLAGQISVLDPDKFTNALVTGFGRSKAFGCGLMLVRRQPSIF